MNRQSLLHLQWLDVLRILAEHLNRISDLQPMLDTALPLVLDLMGLHAGWIMLLDEEGGFYLAAAHGLPPALAADDRAALRRGLCWCQQMLLAGELSAPVNILECERLERICEALQGERAAVKQEMTAGLRYHASVPLRAGEQQLGILNLARAGNEALRDEELALLTLVGETLGTAIHRAQLFEREKAARVRELTARDRILSAILRTADLDERLQIILEEVLAFLSVELGGIHLVEGEEVVLRAWRGISDTFRAHVLCFPASHPPDWMREPRVVHEHLSEAGTIPDFARREGVQAWACVPLYLPSQEGRGGEWLGTITVGSRRYQALGEDKVQALVAMADQVALAIDHACTYRRAQERLVRLQTLRDIDRAIIQHLDLEEVLHVVLERVPQELGAEAVAVSLLDEEQRRPEVFAMRLPNGTVVEEEAFTLAESLLHWFVERQEPVIIYDLSQDPRVQMHRRRIRSGRLASYLGVPLVVREQTIGILHILTTEPRVFAEEDVAFFRTMAGQAAIAIANARAFAETSRRVAVMGAMLAAQMEIETRAAEDIGTVVLKTLQRCLGADHAGFFRYDREREVFTLENAIGFSPELVAAVRPLLVFRLGEERGLVGWVAATRQSLYLPDCHADPRWVRADVSIRSAYFVPLAFGEQIFGVAVLTAPEPGAFPASQRALADLFGHYASAALERARLFREETRRASELAAMLEVAQAISSTLELEEVLALIAEHMAKVMGVAGCTLSRWDQEGDAVVTWVEWRQPGRGAVDQPGTRYGLENFPATREVLEKRRPLTVLVRDPEADPAEVALLRKWNVASLLMLPLTVRERAIGLVELDDEEERAFTPAEIRLCQALADQAAVVIENARLFAETRRRAVHLEVLNAVIAAAVATNDLQALLERTLDHTLRGLGLESGAIWLRPLAQELERVGLESVPITSVRVLRGVSPQVREAIVRVFDGAGLTPDEIDVRGPIVVRDWEAVRVQGPGEGSELDAGGPLGSRIAEVLVRFGVRASITVPILSEGRRVGGLSVASPTPRG